MSTISEKINAAILRDRNAASKVEVMRCPLKKFPDFDGWTGWTDNGDAFIGHSGGLWVSTGLGQNGYFWPLEELFVRRKFTPLVRARIERLNPHGHEEGSRIRGWHPKKPGRRWLKKSGKKFREAVRIYQNRWV